jgi:hypothetical protein
MQIEHALHGRAMKSQLVHAKNPPKIHQNSAKNIVNLFKLRAATQFQRL